jgi:hypothetical protein
LVTLPSVATDHVIVFLIAATFVALQIANSPFAFAFAVADVDWCEHISVVTGFAFGDGAAPGVGVARAAFSAIPNGWVVCASV